MALLGQLNGDGIRVARCRVEWLIHQDGLAGVVRGRTQPTTLPGSSPYRQRISSSGVSRPPVPTSSGWPIFTYVHTCEGWAFLAIVLDV